MCGRPQRRETTAITFVPLTPSAAGSSWAPPRSAHRGEVLSTLSVAVHAGVPTSTLREMIYAYPTFHREIEDALAALEVSA